MKTIPTKEEILNWISENPTLTAKRDIARAFGVAPSAGGLDSTPRRR